jgi:hypothetical protein
MGSKKDGESKTRTTRSVEGGATLNPNDSGGQARARGVSPNNEHLSLGAFGAVGTAADFSGSLAGGILTQLIKQVDNQLGSAKYQVHNAEACLDWYQREKEVYEHRVQDLEEQLEHLRHLESELRKQLELESEISEDDPDLEE